MLSLFKKKPSVDKTTTLKARVELFWKWYAEVAPRFYETIEAKKCASLAPEVIAKIDKLFPGFAWVFGPGENGNGHSFTLSGEGISHRQLVAIYWLSRIPMLPGWTFYASRQPSSIEGKIIDMNQQKFDPIEFWITPVVDLERELIHLTVWHPLFDIMEEQKRQTVLYLFLDEVLGEYGTDQFIGKIDINNQALENAIPLKELLDFTNKIKLEAGWKKYPPGEAGVVYEMKEQHDRYLRGDVYVGSTWQMPLIDAYSSHEGELADPLAGTGADYVFISFDVSILPKGGEAAARGEIEELLDDALKAALSGRVLGGAMGTRHAYIDLMLYDGQNSLDIVCCVLKEKHLPAGTEIHFFAKEKRGHRIVI